MKVRYQQDQDEAKFIRFNFESFPERGDLTKKIMDFRYRNSFNPEGLSSENVLAFDDDENIIGQALYHPGQFYFQGNKIDMQWGFEFFVRPNSRNDLAGIHILEFVKANAKRPSFATGLGDKALKIQKYFGYKVIGSLRKYLRILNPLFFLSGFLREKNIPAKKFPNRVGVGEKIFEKVDILKLWDSKTPYNDDLLEFSREIGFLKWRFFSGHFEYVVYRNVTTSEKPIYFAARTVKFKGVTSLILADFRCDLKSGMEFEMIIDAASKVAFKLFLPILVTGSSHATVDAVLEAKKFKKIGRDRPIVSNSKDYAGEKQVVDDRTFIFLTLADSDGEYLL